MSKLWDSIRLCWCAGSIVCGMLAIITGEFAWLSVVYGLAVIGAFGAVWMGVEAARRKHDDRRGPEADKAAKTA